MWDLPFFTHVVHWLVYPLDSSYQPTLWSARQRCRPAAKHSIQTEIHACSAKLISRWNDSSWSSTHTLDSPSFTFLTQILLDEHTAVGLNCALTWAVHLMMFRERYQFPGGVSIEFHGDFRHSFQTGSGQSDALLTANQTFMVNDLATIEWFLHMYSQTDGN